MLARFGDLSDPGGHRVQIDVRTDGQEGFVVENRHTLWIGMIAGTGAEPP
jgi:hypothetical protein